MIPASGPVIIRSSPSILLTSVDLPALGRPTMASLSGPRRPRPPAPRLRSRNARARRAGGSPRTGRRSPRHARPTRERLAEAERDRPPAARLRRRGLRPCWRRRSPASSRRAASGAISSSSGVRPSRASIRNRATSASRTAASVCARIRPGRLAGPRPRTRRYPSPGIRARADCASPSRRSRVTPGRSSTSATRLPTRRLNSVDLPTLGRPTMATVGRGMARG